MHPSPLHTARSAARLVLVEDDPEVSRTVAAALASCAFQLECARSAADALDLFDDATDLILLDLGLPDRNGLALLREIRQNPRIESTPVILLTARSHSGDKVLGFELGATDYVTKPFDAAELRARVQAHLRTKFLQDELAASRAAAEAGTRAKSEFLATMSHEIRTPMNGVIALTSILLETDLSPQQRELVETIRASGDSLLTIINDILDFSKIESGKLDLERAQFSIRNCLEEALDLLAPRAFEKNLDLAADVDEDLPPTLIGDVTRLRQVLVNLIGNAIKFTAKGEVVVQVRRQPARESVESSRTEILFSVRDTGIGIPQEKQPFLFQSFSQLDASINRRFGGSGLGLAISKSLVELMGGRMWVESTPGKGSTFWFTLCAETAPATAGSSQDPLAGCLEGMRLLVVDDNVTNRRILTLQARKWGMTAECTANGRDALDFLARDSRFNAAILDMQMPEMDGLELGARIRAQYPSLALVLLTSMGVWSDTPKESLSPFVSCLNKPIKPAQLRQVLLRVRRGEAPVRKAGSTPSRLDPDLARRFPLRLLLVDDNAVNQKVALQLLQKMGYTADVVSNGVDAVAAGITGRYDLILMDIQMPEMDGIQATAQIRQSAPVGTRPVIVAMTANAMQGDRERCLEAGMDDYISKPVRPEALRIALERWGAEVASRDQKASDSAGVESNVLPAPIDVPSDPADDAPVNIDQLLDFTDGTIQSVRELASLYLQQSREQLKEIERAIAAEDAAALRLHAHSCAGSSSTCGMRAIVPALRELERRAEDGTVDGTRPIFEQACHELSRIDAFFRAYLEAEESSSAA